MFGYSKIDLFTIEGWQSGVFFTSHDQPHMCWQTAVTPDWHLTIPAIARSRNNDRSPHSSYIASSLQLGAWIVVIIILKYPPGLQWSPVVKMIAVTSWEIFLYLMISWEWSGVASGHHTQSDLLYGSGGDNETRWSSCTKILYHKHSQLLSS